MNILLLEDSVTDADLTRRGLTSSIVNCNVVVAPTLKQAREILLKDITFDIAVLDMILPDGTGLEMLIEIRQSGFDIPAVFLTGSGNEEMATVSLKAGADDYMIKRDDYISKLPGVIDFAIRNHKQNMLLMTEIIDVLYIEHHASDVDLTIRFLNQNSSNIRITALSTAELALEQLPLSETEKCRFKVILLDYRLPGLNALEFTKIIRQERKLSIPIILVTGHGNEEVAIQALKLGVNEYLVKRENYLSHLPSMILNAHEHHELLKKQLALAESEEKYRYLFANNPQPMWIYDLETLAFLEVNDAAIQHYGYTSEEFLSMSLKDIRPKEDIEALLRNIESTANGYNTAGEWRHRKKNGELIFVQIVSHTITFEGRAARHVLVQDITERKRAEEALMISEEKYRTIFENVQDVFYQTDLAGNILEISPSVKYFSEFQKDELIGTPVSNLYFIPSKREILINKLMENGEIRDFELTLKTKTGEKKYVSINARLIFDSNGKPDHIDGAIRDISERKLAEKQIRLLSRGIEQSPVTILITDKNGNIEYVNPKFTELSGYTLEEVKGKNPRILQSGQQPDEFYKELWNTILSGNDWYGELHNKKKNGDSYWESAVISSIIDSQNDISHFIAVKEDISEKKKMVEDLIQAKEHAEESDRLKSAFLANMSHEIRTPMNGILGFAALLKEPKLLSEEFLEYIGLIEQSGARMLNIINDIVDISKIESGLMKVNMKDSNINEQIEYIYKILNPQAERKGLQLLFHNGLNSEKSNIKTDRDKIISILSNLVKNAIKYSENGRIEFGYSLEETKDSLPMKHQTPFLQFYVKDAGIGIPKDRQEAIFERFIQADIGDKRAYQGAGLGLAIAKYYVEMLNGEIWVESIEGKGSTFYFTLPYSSEQTENVTQAKSRAIQVNSEFPKLKILIVEDDETSCFLLYKGVKRFGGEILKVNSGIAAVKECGNNPDLDLILMDIKMPEMDGYEATRQIRQFNKHVIIIAQTAYALMGDREKSIDAGCNDHITKPINPNLLNELIQKHVNRRMQHTMIDK